MKDSKTEPASEAKERIEREAIDASYNIDDSSERQAFYFVSFKADKDIGGKIIKDIGRTARELKERTLKKDSTKRTPS